MMSQQFIPVHFIDGKATCDHYSAGGSVSSQTKPVSPEPHRAPGSKGKATGSRASLSLGFWSNFRLQNNKACFKLGRKENFQAGF